MPYDYNYFLQGVVNPHRCDLLALPELAVRGLPIAWDAGQAIDWELFITPFGRISVENGAI